MSLLERLNDPGRNPQIEGIRAIAVVLVLLVHAGAPGFDGGWIGVDIFFVLSGFLITTLLMTEHEKTGTINLPKFWARRFLRLMPAYLTYVTFITVLILSAGPETIRVYDGWTPNQYLASLWTYTVNYFPHGGIWDGQHMTIHLWSLAVEEQFYFLFPPILLACLALLGGLGGLVATIALGTAFAALTWAGALPGNVISTLNGRGLVLILGCLIAVIFHRMRRSGRMARNPAAFRALFLAGLFGSIMFFVAIMAQAASGYATQAEILISTGPPFFALIGISIAGYWHGHGVLGNVVLGYPVMTVTGRLSYGLYLYHMAAWMIVWEVIDPEIFDALGKYGAYAARMLLYFGLSYLFALASYVWIEETFLKIKNRKMRVLPGGPAQAE